MHQVEGGHAYGFIGGDFPPEQLDHFIRLLFIHPHGISTIDLFEYNGRFLDGAGHGNESRPIKTSIGKRNQIRVSRTVMHVEVSLAVTLVNRPFQQRLSVGHLQIQLLHQEFLISQIFIFCIYIVKPAAAFKITGWRHLLAVAGNNDRLAAQ